VVREGLRLLEEKEREEAKLDWARGADRGAAVTGDRSSAEESCMKGLSPLGPERCEWIAL
jgi:hypothetical protein